MKGEHPCRDLTEGLRLPSAPQPDRQGDHSWGRPVTCPENWQYCCLKASSPQKQKKWGPWALGVKQPYRQKVWTSTEENLSLRSTTFIRVHEAHSWQVMWTSQSIWDYAGQEEKSSFFSSLGTAFRCPIPSIIINKMGRNTASFVRTCKKGSDTRPSCFLTASYYKHTNNMHYMLHKAVTAPF